jgi:hypothetical protein
MHLNSACNAHEYTTKRSDWQINLHLRSLSCFTKNGWGGFDARSHPRYNYDEVKKMTSLKPIASQRLREAKAELARLRAEKLKLFPPNPHPFAQPDTFPTDATQEQIRRRNELVARIEELEKQIEEMER